MIVHSHLLKEKGSVRLRSIICDSSGQFGNEEFTSIESLASEIKERLDLLSSSEEIHSNQKIQSESAKTSERQKSSGKTNARSLKTNLEYIIVETDQFYFYDNYIKENKVKSVRKAFSGIVKRTELYLNQMGIGSNFSENLAMPIVACDIPYAIIRELGTCLMGKSAMTVGGACQQVGRNSPKHKKILKTLSMALESFLRRQEDASDNSSRKSKGASKYYRFSLYSTCDDLFDMILMEM